MRKKILAFVFAAALLVALAVPVFGSGSVYAGHDKGNQKSVDLNTEELCHKPGTSAEKLILVGAVGVGGDEEVRRVDHLGHGDLDVSVATGTGTQVCP